MDPGKLVGEWILLPYSRDRNLRNILTTSVLGLVSWQQKIKFERRLRVFSSLQLTWLQVLIKSPSPTPTKEKLGPVGFTICSPWQRVWGPSISVTEDVTVPGKKPLFIPHPSDPLHFQRTPSSSTKFSPINYNSVLGPWPPVHRSFGSYVYRGHKHEYRYLGKHGYCRNQSIVDVVTLNSKKYSTKYQGLGRWGSP